jgi:hypothetical protein
MIVDATLKFCMNLWKLFEPYSTNECQSTHCQALQNIEFIYVRLSDDQQEFDHCQKSINIIQHKTRSTKLQKIFCLDNFELFNSIEL